MRDERRSRRVARYELIRELYEQGKSQNQIAKELGITRWLVRRFVEADQFPERAPKLVRRTILTPFEPFLHERWQAGERTTPALYRTIQAAGYTGSLHTIRRWVQQRRQEPAAHTLPAYRATYTVKPEEVTARAAAQRRLPGARQLVWLLLNERDKLSDDDQHLLAVLLQEPKVVAAYKLGQRFLRLVRQRQLSELDVWVADCQASGLADLSNFAAGLQQDEAAVRAALTLPWSSGQVEGQITRLKLLKRQMYDSVGELLGCSEQRRKS
jgi:transposase